jgi:hypothetical protein
MTGFSVRTDADLSAETMLRGRRPRERLEDRCFLNMIILLVTGGMAASGFLQPVLGRRGRMARLKDWDAALRWFARRSAAVPSGLPDKAGIPSPALSGSGSAGVISGDAAHGSRCLCRKPLSDGLPPRIGVMSLHYTRP